MKTANGAPIRCYLVADALEDMEDMVDEGRKYTNILDHITWSHGLTDMESRMVREKYASKHLFEEPLNLDM